MTTVTIIIPTEKTLSIGILISSIIGFLSLAFLELGGFSLSEYSGFNSICLLCASTSPAFRGIIFIAVLALFVQVLIGISYFIPQKFLPSILANRGIILASITLGFTLLGGFAIATVYDIFTWWLGVGFYGGLIAGITNVILFYIKRRKK